MRTQAPAAHGRGGRGGVWAFEHVFVPATRLPPDRHGSPYRREPPRRRPST
jgi:hypothetical protein